MVMMKTERILKISCMILVVFCLFSTVYAEKKLYHGYGEYTMSEYETPQIAEQRALAYAKRNILEQVGVYVKTYTRMQNMQITEDEVYIAVGRVLNTIKRDTRKNIQTGGEVHIEANMTAEVDIEEINNIIKNEDNKNSDMSYSILQNVAKRIEHESSNIKEEIVQRKNIKKSTRELEIEIKAKELEFLANEKVEECLIERKKKNYIKGMELAEYAIKLNPKNYLCYLESGNSYNEQDKYDMALKRYKYALVLNKQDARVYYARGNVYANTKEYNKAISDYTRAIKLDDKFADAYYNRAVMYVNLSKYDKALEDVERVLEITPHDHEAEVFMAKIVHKVL